MKFTELSLNPDLLTGIEALRFSELTPIQEEVIPRVIAGKDMIACAQTGTGKTGAYLIPTIEKLSQTESDYTRALIIAPTRELVGQIDQNLEALSYFSGVSSSTIYGGGNSKEWERQKSSLERGTDIIIATPGRLKVHLAFDYVNFKHIEMVILDEADKMLDMGFFEDIIQIFSHLPEVRQTLLLSATMPPKIQKLAHKILKDPDEITLNLSVPAAGIKQEIYSVYDEQKIPLLLHILENEDIDSMIIFASSKLSVDKITQQLKRKKIKAESIHSDKTQEEREDTLRKFKNKSFPVLIGTDILARGIDIDNLSHVLNFDTPLDAEDYVHRIGRTARASSTGEAITFVNPKDHRKMRSIEKLIQQAVPQQQVPEELGEPPVYHPFDPNRKPSNKQNRSRNNRNKKRPQNRSRQGRRPQNDQRGASQTPRQQGEKSENPRKGENPKQEGQGQGQKSNQKRRNRRRPKKQIE